MVDFTSIDYGFDIVVVLLDAATNLPISTPLPRLGMSVSRNLMLLRVFMFVW